MRKVLWSAAGIALGACSGDGPGLTDPESQFVPPPAAELVRDAIPYDSLGRTTIYFQRWLGGDQIGYVRLTPSTRSVDVFGVYGLGLSPAVSSANKLLAYWEWELLSTPQDPGLGRAGIFSHPVGSPRSAAVRISSAEYRSRGGPAWSPDGRTIYYLESTAVDGVSRVVRQSPVPDAADRVGVVTLPRACGLERAGSLAIAVTGDAVVSQNSVASNNECRSQLLRWRPADQSLSVLVELNGSRMIPTWSPDGSRIAVITRVSNRFQIRIMDADGANPTLIHDSAASFAGVLGIDESICWSGDGSRIVFSQYSDHSLARIFAIRPDGSGLTPITSPVAGSRDPGAPEIAADGTLSCSP